MCSPLEMFFHFREILGKNEIKVKIQNHTVAKQLRVILFFFCLNINNNVSSFNNNYTETNKYHVFHLWLMF